MGNVGELLHCLISEDRWDFCLFLATQTFPGGDPQPPWLPAALAAEFDSCELFLSGGLCLTNAESGSRPTPSE